MRPAKLRFAFLLPLPLPPTPEQPPRKKQKPTPLVPSTPVVARRRMTTPVVNIPPTPEQPPKKKTTSSFRNFPRGRPWSWNNAARKISGISRASGLPRPYFQNADPGRHAPCQSRAATTSPSQLSTSPPATTLKTNGDSAPPPLCRSQAPLGNASREAPLRIPAPATSLRTNDNSPLQNQKAHQSSSRRSRACERIPLNQKPLVPSLCGGMRV